ncbi:MAG: hypothetical protein CSB01_02610 [Bacteroidia bacterium]|nr:MAG: hypothetical protein CSB01_02610 [Bacteroidia bacterium]
MITLIKIVRIAGLLLIIAGCMVEFFLLISKGHMISEIMIERRFTAISVGLIIFFGANIIRKKIENESQK